MNRILIHISINIRKFLIDELKQSLKEFNKKYGTNTTIEAASDNHAENWLRECLTKDSMPDMAIAHATDLMLFSRDKLREILLPLRGRFPLSSDLDERGLRDPDGILHPFCLIPFVMVCNSRMVSEEERPSTWEDLVDPKWHHMVTFPDVNTPISQVVLAFLKAQYPEKFPQFYASIKFQNSPVEVIKSIAEGLFPLGITNLGFAQMMQVRDAVPIVPAEGPICSPLVLLYARHADQRLLEMGDLLFGQRIQALLSRQGFIPVNTKSPTMAGVPDEAFRFCWDGWDQYFDNLQKGNVNL